MLKLMTEQIHDVNLLTEEKDGQKEYFIEGIFHASRTKEQKR